MTIKQAVYTIREYLINDIGFRAEVFMAIGKSVMGQVSEFAPDKIDDETLIKISDKVAEEMINTLFDVELSAEATKETLRQLKAN